MLESTYGSIWKTAEKPQVRLWEGRGERALLPVPALPAGEASSDSCAFSVSQLTGNQLALVSLLMEVHMYCLCAVFKR